MRKCTNIFITLCSFQDRIYKTRGKTIQQEFKIIKTRIRNYYNKNLKLLEGESEI